MDEKTGHNVLSPFLLGKCNQREKQVEETVACKMS